MTWLKASPIIVVAAIFWVLRMMFEMFWLFGAVFIGLAASFAAQNWVASHIGEGHISHAAGYLAGLTAGGAAGTFGGPELEIFGIIMAMIVGFFGWMVITLALAMTNSRIFKENPSGMIWLMLGLGISEVPLLGALPSTLGAVVNMYRIQIKKEKAALKKWNQEHAAELQAARRQQAAYLLQQAQENAATEEAQEEESAEQEAEEEDVANDALRNSFENTYDPANIPEPANENEEIPEALQNAA
jgi:hypothetical protein